MSPPVTDVLRLTLVSHAMTESMAAGRFPVDEPLSDTGRRQVAHHGVDSDAHALAGPEQRARQTAHLLGLQATGEPRLADLDCGRWRGATLQDIPPADLMTWLADPAAAPHGGESVVDLIDRVTGWLESLVSQADNAIRTVAVTHPAVIRAAILVALDAPPKSFWRIDIAPVSRTVLHHRGPGWTLRLPPGL